MEGRQVRACGTASEVKAERSGAILLRLGGDRGQRQRTPLGTHAQRAATYGAVDGAAVREALRKVAEERRQRCGGNLRGSESTLHALRCTEVSGAAGPAVPAPCSRSARRQSDTTHQPDPWSAGRVWDRVATASEAGQGEAGFQDLLTISTCCALFKSLLLEASNFNLDHVGFVKQI